MVGASAEDSNSTVIENSDGTSDANNSVQGAGAAYVFKIDTNGNWVQDTTLKAANTEELDGFGESVSVSEDLIVIGAYYEDSTSDEIENTDGESDVDNTASKAGAVSL